MKPLILGLAGTAKNTGKTTTTATILNQARQKNLKLAITSIGLDGERLDHLTGLPKPKLFAPKGTFVLTAESSLPFSDAKIEIIEHLPHSIALGPLILGQVKKEGTVLLAGPHKKKMLEALAYALGERGIELLLVDGALNRMAPLASSDLFVLATGAARNSHIPTLFAETKALLEILLIEKIEKSLQRKYLWAHSQMQASSFIVKGKEVMPLQQDSLLSMAMVEELLLPLAIDFDYLYLQGILSSKAWEGLMKILQGKKPRHILLANPINLMLAGDIFTVLRFMEKWRKMGGTLAVEHPLPLKAVTINPFYPLWQGQMFEAAYIDGQELKKQMRALELPVFNVLEDDPRELWQSIFAD